MSLFLYLCSTLLKRQRGTTHFTKKYILLKTFFCLLLYSLKVLNVLILIKSAQKFFSKQSQSCRFVYIFRFQSSHRYLKQDVKEGCTIDIYGLHMCVQTAEGLLFLDRINLNYKEPRQVIVIAV
jgi:hypothetical protein